MTDQHDDTRTHARTHAHTHARTQATHARNAHTVVRLQRHETFDGYARRTGAPLQQFTPVGVTHFRHTLEEPLHHRMVSVQLVVLAAELRVALPVVEVHAIQPAQVQFQLRVVEHRHQVGRDHFVETLQEAPQLLAHLFCVFVRVR